MAFLSVNLCQDPLEVFFGCQCQRGRTSDNPSISEFFKNTAALRVVNSFCRVQKTGNCRGNKQLRESAKGRTLEEHEVAPLQKAKRRRLATL